VSFDDSNKSKIIFADSRTILIKYRRCLDQR